MRPRSTWPSAVIDKVSGPGVITVSPPSSGQAKFSASSARPEAKRSSHSGVQSGGRHSESRKPSGVAPLAAMSERFTRKALARDRVGRIVGEKMHAGDERVGGDDEIAAGRRFEPRDVVLQRQPALARHRGEEARDELVFGGAGGHCRDLCDISLRKYRGGSGPLEPRRSVRNGGLEAGGPGSAPWLGEICGHQKEIVLSEVADSIRRGLRQAFHVPDRPSAPSRFLGNAPGTEGPSRRLYPAQNPAYWR